jgi:hypothetical protein
LTKKAIRILDDAIDAAPEVELHLQGRVGDVSATAVNRLLARYPGSNWSGYSLDQQLCCEENRCGIELSPAGELC